MSPRTPTNPYVLYADCMEEIKKRVSVINGFLTGKCHTLFIQTTAESVCLQIRKILELIALASLAANKEAYQQHRESFYSDWNGKRILEALKTANPRFYPVPNKQVVDRVTGKVTSLEEITSGFLTKDGYMQLYDLCGGILHASNPFSEVPPNRNPKVFLESVPTWMQKIMLLLNHHTTQLLNDSQQLWVLMQAESDGRVHVHEFEVVDVSQG